jgi:hypothetical protein
LTLRAIAAAALLLVNVPAHADSPANVQEELKKAFARELPPLEVVRFETPGGLKGAVEAKGAPAVQGGADAEIVTIDLGTAQPVRCTIVRSRVDVAAFVQRYVNGVKDRVSIVAIRPVAVAVAARSPLLFAEIVYSADSPEGKRLGHAQLGIHAHDARSVICEQDEPGYEKTFQRVVTGLASRLEGGGEDARAGARYREIVVTRVGEMPVGFTEHVVWDRKGGGRVAKVWTSQLLPRSPTEIVAKDGYSEELYDAKDLLELGSYANAEGGEIAARMKVTRGKDGVSYAYDGEQQGKKLAGTFKSRAGLATDLWFARRFDKARGYGPKGEVRAQGYDLEANPAGPLEISYRKDPKRARGVALSVGPIQFTGVLDDAGIVTDSEVPVGPATLIVHRVFVQGTP